MPKVATFIDTVFDAVIDITLRILNVYYRESRESVIELPPPPKEVAEVEEDEGELTFKTLDDLLRHQNAMRAEAAKNTVMYAKNISVPVYKNPTIEFDTQVGSIPYGEMVMMLEPRGRFFKVMWNTLEGWVLKDDLADRAAYVYPEFVIGEENSIDSPNTSHTRAIIGDIFNARNTQLPLQAGEYVLYKLWKKGKKIHWPTRSDPRVPGLWHKILRGTPGVHIGVVPKTGALMEYMLNTEVGHLAYVEAVFPDDTFTISEANFPDSGIYNERVLTKEEWRELKPTFITIQ